MNFEERSQKLTIQNGNSQLAHKHGLVVSVQQWDSSSATLVFGCPGFINETKKFAVGEASIYQMPSHDQVEIRLLSRSVSAAEVLLTKVLPWPGFEMSAQLGEEDNSKFSAQEVLRIKQSVEKIKLDISNDPSISSAHRARLFKPLDEVASGAERIGRKDWVMFVLGTLSSVATNTYLPPEVVKPFVASVQAHLGWIFHAAVRLIGA